MVQGRNCGFVLPPDDLERHTCTCGEGYMNDEGTLIPGSIIKEGYALAKPDYHAHKGCGQCKVNPLKCDWRQRHLHPGPRRITINAPPNGMFEFFVNSEGISESVLRAFLQRNNNDEIDEITCLRGRRFKRENGFFVRSSFRLNRKDHDQLRELTHLQKRGRMWEGQLQRKPAASRQPFNEFSRYMRKDKARHSSDSSDSNESRSPSPSYLASAPEKMEGGYRYSQSAAKNDNLGRTKSARPGIDLDEDVAVVTSRASRMTIPTKYEISSQGLPSKNRTSNENIQNPRAWDEGSPKGRYATVSESQPQLASTRIESMPTLVNQRPPQPSLFRPQSNDADDEDLPVSSRRESDGRRNTNYDVSRESRSPPVTVQRPQIYSSPSRSQDATTRSYTMDVTEMNSSNEIYSRGDINYNAGSAPYGPVPTTHSTQTYGSPDPHYGPVASTGNNAPVAIYSTSTSVQARHLTASDPYAVQTRSDTHNIPQTTRNPTRPSSHTARGHKVAADDDNDDTSSVSKVKCWLPADGIDPEVLALYLGYCIDPKSRVQRASWKDREGFHIEASRKLTTDDIAEILKDSKSWKKESERGGGRYRDSETARRRRERRRR